MKRIYIIVGELEDTDTIDVIYGAVSTMAHAEEICTILEAHPDNHHIWSWREKILEEE